MSLEELYQEVILDHHKHPRGKGVLLSPDATAALFNPLCGDQISLSIQLQDGEKCRLAFDGHGCSISQAAASVMIELSEGKSVSELRELLEKFTKLMKGELEDADRDILGDAIAFEGVQKFAARIKCAMLGWEALHQCLSQLEKK